MANRDRMISLFSPFADGTYNCSGIIIDGTKVDDVVDSFIANGVIVLPCEAGDRYVMDTAKNIFNAWNDVTGAVVKGTSWYYELESVIEDIVKWSFGAGVLYREEAEARLKELSDGTT